MTPSTKLKYAILHLNAQWKEEELPTHLSESTVLDLWDEKLLALHDAVYETRSNGTPTGINAPSSRHYESESVAVQCPNGEWVGFTYWYGGGKHGNPEEIDWIEQAYDVNCTEERKMMVVQTFEKVGEP